MTKKRKEIITDLDTFGEFLNEFEEQHTKEETKKKFQTQNTRKEEVIKDLDTFGDFLGEFDEQHDLDVTLNHQHKGFSLKRLFHHEQKKKEITYTDFPKYLKKYSLTHMLQYPKLREYLKKSSEKSFCAENVDFYEAILDFKKLKKQHDRNAKANEIYYSFLELGSPNEVNLSDQQKQIIYSKINCAPKNLFDAVEYEIQNMIKTENYYRFIHTEDDFGRMLQEHENIILKGGPSGSSRSSGNIA
eukprot:gene499-8013_t